MALYLGLEGNRVMRLSLIFSPFDGELPVDEAHGYGSVARLL